VDGRLAIVSSRQELKVQNLNVIAKLKNATCMYKEAGVRRRKREEIKQEKRKRNEEDTEKKEGGTSRSTRVLQAVVVAMWLSQ